MRLGDGAYVQKHDSVRAKCVQRTSSWVWLESKVRVTENETDKYTGARSRRALLGI